MHVDGGQEGGGLGYISTLPHLQHLDSDIFPFPAADRVGREIVYSFDDDGLGLLTRGKLTH